MVMLHDCVLILNEMKMIKTHKTQKIYDEKQQKNS